MLLVIDNYDSFTWNIVHYLRELGAQVEVRRNDALELSDLDAMAPTGLLLSPGPCTPDQAGITLAAITHCAGRIPILGVCLGHQAIGQVFGAQVVRARLVMHGKTSWIRHRGQGVFEGLDDPLQVTRYHSLLLEVETLPPQLQVTAWTETDAGVVDEIMAIRHRTLDVEGVQFHPESILSQQGHALLANFLARTRRAG